MKLSKIAATVAVASLSSASMAGVIFSEGFDNVSGLSAAGWAFVNASAGGGQNWFQGNPGPIVADSGAADSYAAANLLSGAGAISNWLMTPVLTMSGGGSVNFVARVDDDGGSGLFLDTVEVWLSTAGASTDVADFTTLLGSYSGTTDLGWVAQGYNVNLSGQGRLGFRYVATNAGSGPYANYLGIDSLSVVPEPGSLALVGVALAGLAALRRRAQA